MEKVAVSNVTEISFWNRDSIQYVSLLHAWAQISVLIHKVKFDIACLKQDLEPLTLRLEEWRQETWKAMGLARVDQSWKDKAQILPTQHSTTKSCWHHRCRPVNWNLDLQNYRKIKLCSSKLLNWYIIFKHWQETNTSIYCLVINVLMASKSTWHSASILIMLLVIVEKKKLHKVGKLTSADSLRRHSHGGRECLAAGQEARWSHCFQGLEAKTKQKMVLSCKISKPTPTQCFPFSSKTSPIKGSTSFWNSIVS